MLFWIVRMWVALVALILIIFSWRASLVVAACLVLEFAGMISAAMPPGGLWSVAQVMVCLGFGLGVVTSFGGAQRRGLGDLALLALGTNALLALSWGSALLEMGTAWFSYLVYVLSLPTGVFAASALFAAWRRTRVLRSERRR